MRVNYITSQSLSTASGGWSGLSHNLYHQLASEKDLQINYAGPVHPPVSRAAKLVSKARRILGGRGRFYAFSEERLEAIHRQVRAARRPADYDLFLGATPWVRCRFEQPYGAYLDACFRTYFDNNLRTSEFSREDARRIERQEKEWLEKAHTVFWASAWSRDEAIRHYGLSSENHVVASIGGNLAPPASDTYAAEISFLFIAQNFALKGGPIACAALQAVRRRHPEATLTVLGQQPPAEYARMPGVRYAGYLRKTEPDQLAQFRSILASSFCLVHPTQSDTIAQGIVEAAYFGCPSIAPRRFAIPELILDRQTGVLVDTPFTPGDIEREMLWMLEQPARYAELRRAARSHAVQNLNFETVGKRIVQRMSKQGSPEAKSSQGMTVDSR